MTRSIVAALVESRDIHIATCRARRQGLVCSACCELIERAEQQIRRTAVPLAEVA